MLDLRKSKDYIFNQYLKKYSKLGKVREEFSDLAQRKEKITKQEFEEIKCNAYERQILMFNLTNEALISYFEEGTREMGKFNSEVLIGDNKTFPIYGPIMILIYFRLKESLNVDEEIKEE